MLEISSQLSPTQKTLPASSSLGFGQHFTDHWFVARYTTDKGWFEARVEPYGKLSLDPAASVFHYGQALFEGMKAFRREDGSIWLFRPDFNVRRMAEGAQRLCLEAPPAQVFTEGLKKLVQIDQRWVPADEGSSLYIRPTLIGTEAFLGVRPSREVIFYILLSPVGSYYSGGSAPVKIWVEEKDLRAAPGGLGAVKAGANYAASLRAALAAREKGYSQVLWLDKDHEGIEEVGTMNVFFVMKDEVITPALNGSILGGGVRDSAIQLLRKKGHRVTERRITIRELNEAHQNGLVLEAFGTGTAAVITPIGEMCHGGHVMQFSRGQMGPVSKDLFDTITGIQRGRVADEFGWMRRLEDL